MKLLGLLELLKLLELLELLELGRLLGRLFRRLYDGIIAVRGFIVGVFIAEGFIVAVGFVCRITFWRFFAIIGLFEGLFEGYMKNYS